MVGCSGGLQFLPGAWRCDEVAPKACASTAQFRDQNMCDIFQEACAKATSRCYYCVASSIVRGTRVARAMRACVCKVREKNQFLSLMQCGHWPWTVWNLVSVPTPPRFVYDVTIQACETKHQPFGERRQPWWLEGCPNCLSSKQVSAVQTLSRRPMRIWRVVVMASASYRTSTEPKDWMSSHEEQDWGGGRGGLEQATRDCRS